MRMPLAIALVATSLVAFPACENKENRYASSGVSTLKLESLHRGELAAVETYRQAIEKEGADAGILTRLKSEHQDAADRLRDRITSLGGTASTSSGVWGGFAKAIEGAAKVFGNKAALEVLKQGEEHGVNEYEEALTDPKVDVASKDLIRTTLLPRQRQHVTTLSERLTASN